jgi:type III secretion protein J
MNRRLVYYLRGAAVLSCLALAGCNEELYAKLEEQEANEMVAVLVQQGITASKRSDKDGSKTIIVDEKRFAAAVTTLTEAGYPRKKFESIGDIFKPGGLVPSPTEERARWLYATDQELSATISQIQGVISARVEVVLPDTDLLSRSPSLSSASVFVRYKENSGIDRLVPQLKMLVANSVQGLGYDRVSIVLVAETPRALPTIAPTLPFDYGTLALAALAGVLATSGAGALAFRLMSRPVRNLESSRRQDQVGTSTINSLLGPVS